MSHFHVFSWSTEKGSGCVYINNSLSYSQGEDSLAGEDHLEVHLETTQSMKEKKSIVGVYLDKNKDLQRLNQTVCFLPMSLLARSLHLLLHSTRAVPSPPLRSSLYLEGPTATLSHHPVSLQHPLHHQQ